MITSVSYQHTIDYYFPYILCIYTIYISLDPFGTKSNGIHEEIVK